MDIERDLDTQVEDICIALEALYEVFRSRNLLLSTFLTPTRWCSKAAPQSNRKEFISQERRVGRDPHGSNREHPQRSQVEGKNDGESSKDCRPRSLEEMM